jgi:hypothetical protein
VARPTLRPRTAARGAVRVQAAASGYKWLNKDLTVVFAGTLG